MACSRVSSRGFLAHQLWSTMPSVSYREEPSTSSSCAVSLNIHFVVQRGCPRKVPLLDLRCTRRLHAQPCERPTHTYLDPTAEGQCFNYFALEPQRLPPTYCTQFAGVSNTSTLYKRGIRVCTGTGLGAALSTCLQVSSLTPTANHHSHLSLLQSPDW